MSELHIGFTGTRLGMSIPQSLVVAAFVEDTDWVHHGDCLGGDAQTHMIARSAGKKVWVHPPVNATLRAFCEADIVEDPLDYLVRDQKIVDKTAYLIAAPRTMEEQKRGSGTWWTVRYARRMGRKIVIVFPDGSMKEERFR